MDNPILKDKFGRDVAIKDGDILALTETEGEFTGITLYYFVVKLKCGFFYTTVHRSERGFVFFEPIPYNNFGTREFEIVANVKDFKFFKGGINGQQNFI